MESTSEVITARFSKSDLLMLSTPSHNPLYTVKLSTQLPQMTIIHHERETEFNSTASFQQFSTQASLNVLNNRIPLRRSSFQSRASNFSSSTEGPLSWIPDGILKGKFKLINEKGEIIAAYKNKTLGSSEMGSFEIFAGVDDDVVDEVVVSGLAMLVLAQSGSLASIINVKSDSQSLSPMQGF